MISKTIIKIRYVVLHLVKMACVSLLIHVRFLNGENDVYLLSGSKRFEGVHFKDLVFQKLLLVQVL